MAMTRPPASGTPGDLARLRTAARRCRACDLWRPATQTVFGEGPADARRMVVGEQAGDHEDLAGRPFVGPSGHLLDEALQRAGLARESLYVTNVVKHFKFEQRGKRRLHQRADAAEVAACLRWLDREMDLLAPRYVLCLGALAAKTVIARDFSVMKQRGRWMRIGARRWALATVHPSLVLRLAGRGEGASARATFERDIAAFARPPGDDEEAG